MTSLDERLAAAAEAAREQYAKEIQRAFDRTVADDTRQAERRQAAAAARVTEIETLWAVATALRSRYTTDAYVTIGPRTTYSDKGPITYDSEPELYFDKQRVAVEYVHKTYSKPAALVIGSYGDRVRFPARSVGGFNYPKIAQRIGEQYEASIARAKSRAAAKAAAQEQERVIESNEPAAEALRKELGVNKWGEPFNVNASTAVGRPAHVRVSLSRIMTADDARKLHAFLKDNGFLN